MRTQRATVLVALAALASAARPAAAAVLNACTAADIIAQNAADCPNNTNPCTISKDFTIGDGCTLDFGTRAVTLKSGTTMIINARTMTLKAGSYTIAGGGEMNARGELAAPNDRGGFVTIQTTGAVNIQKASQLGRIDVSGITASGAVRIVAGGTVTIAGKIIGNNLSTTAGGGDIAIDAGGDIITLAGSILQANSGAGVSGGFDLTATGRIDLGDVIDVDGGDGGTVSLTANADVVARGINGDANGDGGSGGELDILAGTSVQSLGQVLLRGTSSADQTSGGCGGTVDAESRYGDLTISANMFADGASPDGAGGSIMLTSAGTMRLNSPASITARSGGAQSCGGEVCIISSRDYIASASMDVSAGSGGGTIDILASGSATISGAMIANVSATDGLGGEIDVTAGDGSSGNITLSALVDASGGNCDAFNFCGEGGIVDIFGCNVTLQSTGSITTRGGNGGSTTLTAREQLTVSGPVNATKLTGPGIDGTNVFQHTSRKAPVITGAVTPAATLAPQTTCTAPNVPSGCFPPCPTCGNGIVEYPETCDTLGAPVSCDGCSVYCQIENCNDANICTTDSCNATLGCRNVAVANGTSCSDGLVCNGVEQCLNGFCFGTPLNCNDNNSCTTDTCVEPVGCQHVNALPGAPCSDGNACTSGDTCNATGSCQPGAPLVCNDNRECTTDTCNTATGCVFTNRTGSCTDDGNPCTSDTCSAGNCTHPALANGTACSDGQFCTINDACQAGVCLGGTARDCADANPCTVDSCNETSDQCVHAPASPGASCSDGNACTVGDACDASGVCQPGATANCDDNNECTDDSCNPATGCVHVPHNGSCTDDGNACSFDLCSGTTCTHPARPNGTSCEDGLFCTSPDTCQSGTCTAGPQRSCSDANSCTTDTCNEATDTCDHTNVTPGTTCTDNDACTVGDACDASGTCVPGPPANCNDNQECTTDSCNSATGCVHTNVVGPCTDDGNQCTTDVCAGGLCTHPSRADGTGCDDGLFCTVGDRCVGGSCTPTGARDCTDASACTADSCNETTDTCDHTPLPVNTPCSDGDACTVGDACTAAGVCQPGPAADCDDHNDCTIDSCTAAGGCQHVARNGSCTDDGNACTTDVCNAGVCTHPSRPNGTACEDGAFCTVNDTCQGGACQAGPARNCNDNNACTTDTCDETNDTCVQTPIVPCCGNATTESPEQCDDGNTVDTDACRNNCQLAVCGDGVVRTGFEQCDQGAANSNAPDATCRTDCLPRRCGDGIVDPGAGEQCDDGNTLGGDGCSATCFFELSPTAQRIPGKATSTSECVAEWAVEHPVLDKTGAPSLKQTCKDGDPACDFDNTVGTCTFHVWLCANNHDVRLPACMPGPGGVGTSALVDVKKPSAKSIILHPGDGPLRNLIVDAAMHAQTTTFDACGPRLVITVPLKSPTIKGTRPITIKATATGGAADADNLKLICTP